MVGFNYFIIVSCCTAFNFAQSLHARSVPWPPIPSPQPFEPPSGQTYVYPVHVVQGLTNEVSSARALFPLEFNSIGEINTLDYGKDVAGKPVFNISAVEDYAQIEVKYSEAFT